jgi:hypothetical protein
LPSNAGIFNSGRLGRENMWIEAGGADCGTLRRVIYGIDAVCAPVSRRHRRNA